MYILFSERVTHNLQFPHVPTTHTSQVVTDITNSENSNYSVRSKITYLVKRTLQLLEEKQFEQQLSGEELNEQLVKARSQARLMIIEAQSDEQLKELLNMEQLNVEQLETQIRKLELQIKVQLLMKLYRLSSLGAHADKITDPFHKLSTAEYTQGKSSSGYPLMYPRDVYKLAEYMLCQYANLMSQQKSMLLLGDQSTSTARISGRFAHDDSCLKTPQDKAAVVYKSRAENNGKLPDNGNFSQDSIQGDEEQRRIDSQHNVIFPSLGSWDAEISRHSSDLDSLYAFIGSLQLEELTKKDMESRTICDALVSCGHHSFFGINDILSYVLHMSCQDAFGNTLLHSTIEAQSRNSNLNTFVRILGLAPPVCLEKRNEDKLTPLFLAFEKKLWLPARALAEHQIKHGASHGLLQECFFRAMREQGGVEFLAHLLDLRKRYFPDLNLNFSANERGHTPWWYLLNSNDEGIINKVLQTLKEHSIDPTHLLTHTKRRTRLVDEAADKNRLLFTAIQEIGGWHHSGSNQDTAKGNEESSDGVLSRTTSCSSVPAFSSFNEPENQCEPDMLSKMSVIEREDHHVPTSNEKQQQVDLPHVFPTPVSWDAEVQKCCENFPSLDKFIQSLPPEVLTQKDAQSRTVCHALGDLRCHLSSDEVNYIPELLSRVCLPECMIWQDTSGNTPLHCMIEAQNTQNVDAILRSVPNVAECLEKRNEDNLTPLDLAFEKKLWVPARVLAEHQLKHEASPVLLQEYFFRAMKEQGGVEFLPHLLDLRKRCFPDLNLNFSTDTGGRTPWWYLLNSNDPNVMLRALQTLKNHSINPMQLLTHTERQTKLVEEAADKNKLLLTTIQMVADQHHSSEADQDAADGDESSSGVLSRASSHSSISTNSFSDQSENMAISHNNSSMTYQDRHMSPTSDSSSEEQKQVDSRLKPTKRRSKLQRAKVT